MTKTSTDYGPQFDPADGTIGPLRLVRRWAMTHPETGLTWPAQQGRHTYGTEGEAREILDGIRTACPASRYPGVHLLDVRAVWCYPGHLDPCGLCEPPAPAPDLQRCNACGAVFPEQETSCPECGRDDCLMYPIEPLPDPRPASRHTPGPWHYMPGYPAIVSEVVEIPGDFEAGTSAEMLKVVDLFGAMGGDDTGADARLMAASPRLLDALRGLLECPALNEDEAEPETRAAVAEAWAAINDATQQ
jgi:hypothetical protein